MKKALLLMNSCGCLGCGALLWLCTSAFGWALSAGAAEPRLVCEEPAFDFGVARETQVISHTFMLHNTGGVTANIVRVHSTCGCTTFQPTRPAVAPGETEPLTVLFTLKGRHGAQKRPVYVSWNSADGQPLRLTLSGVSIADIEVEPSVALFGSAPLSGALEQVVRIYDPASNRLFRITGVTCTDARFTTRIETGVEGHDYRLVVGSAGPREAGTITASVTVTTDHPERPVVNVPIYLRAQEPSEKPASDRVRDGAKKVSK